MTLADQIENYGRALRVDEFAKLVNVSEKTLRRMIKARKLPTIRIGAQVRLDPARMAEWLRARSN